MPCFSFASANTRSIFSFRSRCRSLYQAAQQALNEAAGLGLWAITAPLDADRVDGILNRLAAAERYEGAAWLLNEPVRLLARSAVDETVRRNVEFKAKAGLRPRVVRTAESGACKWCRAGREL